MGRVIDNKLLIVQSLSVFKYFMETKISSIFGFFLVFPMKKSELCFFFSLLQITFYEEKNFQGRSYECSTDCSDIHMHLNRCNSCRVDNGCFVVYDRPNFLGNQVFLRRGDYPDFQRMGSMTGMMGIAMMDNIRSCRMIPMVGYRIRRVLLRAFGSLRY